MVSLTACASTTVFQSDFGTNTLNQPPAHAQKTGTANVDGPTGSVLVVPAPAGANGQWVRVRRANGPTLAALQGNLSSFGGAGFYTFSAHLYVPSGSGVASIQFERFGQASDDYAGFLHLDFLPENRVRIDDNAATTFGTFKRDQPFVVQVTLNISATEPATAHIVLAGVDASGTADYTILPPFQSFARQFGAVRVWQGFPHTGAFHVTNILVTRRD
jgi:hypothetical protein